MGLAEIADLDRRFAIPGVANVVAGNGGLPKVTIATPNAVGEMYLHGAHVTGWQPRGAESVLFVSSKSHWEPGRAIRGGVPICFPWFGNKADNPQAPAHGFVRTTEWQLESIVQSGDAVTVSMFTESNDDTKKWWPAEFRLVHRATLGAQLILELALTNTGTSPLRFEEALHAYFRVGQIDKARVQGLNDVEYLDKTDSNQMKTQRGLIEIVSETDRVYLNTAGAVELEDRSLGHRIRVAKENSLNTVVWNPWIEKAKAMADFGDTEWQQMICVEASNVADCAVQLEPGHQHAMRTIVRVGGL